MQRSPDSIVSDMFGKSVTLITDYLINTDEFDPEYCKTFLQKSLKKKSDTVIESIQGYQIEQAQKERMLMVREHLEFVENAIEKLDSKLDSLVKP